MKRLLLLFVLLSLINITVCTQTLYFFSYYELCEATSLDIYNNPLQTSATNLSLQYPDANFVYAPGVLLKNDSLYVELAVQKREPGVFKTIGEPGAEYNTLLQFVFFIPDSKIVICNNVTEERDFFDSMIEDENYVSGAHVSGFAISDNQTALLIDNRKKSIILYVFDDSKIELKSIDISSENYKKLKQQNDSKKINTYPFPDKWSQNTTSLIDKLQSERVKFKSKKIIKCYSNNVDIEALTASDVFDSYFQQGFWNYYDAMAFGLTGCVKKCEFINCSSDTNFGSDLKEVNFKKNGILESSDEISRDSLRRITKVGQRSITYNENGLIKSVSSVSIKDITDDLEMTDEQKAKADPKKHSTISTLTTHMEMDSLNYFYIDNSVYQIKNSSKRSYLVGKDYINDVTYKISDVKLDSHGNWIERTVDNGNNRHQEKRLISYYEDLIPNTAKEYYKKGCQFYYGQGELKNLEKAASFLKKAEELGYVNEHFKNLKGTKGNQQKSVVRKANTHRRTQKTRK